MGSHPINLALRLVLEMSALVSVGAFGWIRFEGSARWLAVVGLPLIFMALWGTFAVVGDPSRSGSAPVPVPGNVRLALELALFGAGSASLYFAGYPRLAFTFGAIVLAHYVASWDRIAWLVQQ